MQFSPSYRLADDEVQVWCVSLDLEEQGLYRYYSMLSPDEIERARRFYFEKDRKHFITGRGILRTLLGGYLGVEPIMIRIRYEIYGKPYLDSDLQTRILRFNVSHSNGLAVYAFSWNRRVGIDVEKLRSRVEEEHFAEQLFSSPETLYLRALPVAEKRRAFFGIWTTKEAYLKACGSGLAVPVDRVEVNWDVGGAPRLVAIDGDQERASGWEVQMFFPAPGYLTSLVVEGHDWQRVDRHLNLNS